MDLVIIVGHTAKKRGAHNKKHDVSEFDFNEGLAQRISKLLCCIEHEIKYRDTYKGLPFEVNELNPGFIISLHCNGFNMKASGTEMLYYHKSVRGKEIAEIFQESIVNALQLPDRGIKGKGTEDRGGYLLRYTNSPCIICEPFFIDRNEDLERAKESCNVLANAYVQSIYNVRNLII